MATIQEFIETIQPGDERLTRLLRAMAKRAFWFTSLLVSTIAFILCMAIILGAGMRPDGNDGWVPVLAFVSLGASVTAMVVSLIGYSIRHVEMYRVLAEITEQERGEK